MRISMYVLHITTYLKHLQQLPPLKKQLIDYFTANNFFHNFLVAYVHTIKIMILKNTYRNQ